MSWKKIMKLDVFDEKDPLDWMDDYISDSNPRKDRDQKGPKTDTDTSNQLEAVQKLLRDDEDMGLNDIFFLNKYFKGLLKKGGKYNRDENYDEYNNILDLSEKLESVMSNLEDYLGEATELLEDIGL